MKTTIAFLFAAVLLAGGGSVHVEAAPTGCGYWYATIDYSNQDRRISNTFHFCNPDVVGINRALHQVAADPRAFIGPFGLFADRAAAESSRTATLTVMRGHSGFNPTPWNVPDPLGN